MINRAAAATAIAKAIAYKLCGKDAEAHEWASRLIEMLRNADIIKGDNL